MRAVTDLRPGREAAGGRTAPAEPTLTPKTAALRLATDQSHAKRIPFYRATGSRSWSPQMAPATPPLPTTVYAMFTGPVNQESLQRIFQGFGAASTSGVISLHALFQSTGGLVNEGVALYNFFRTLPFVLHLYNGGSVASIAAIAFLGAQHRYATANATFMIHKTHMSPPPGTNAARLRAFADSIEIDDRRTRAILDFSLKLKKDVLDLHIETELPFTADDALTAGLIHAIKDFSPPKGVKIFNI